LRFSQVGGKNKWFHTLELKKNSKIDIFPVSRMMHLKLSKALDKGIFNAIDPTSLLS
jgi:hypothetical protein